MTYQDENLKAVEKALAGPKPVNTANVSDLLDDINTILHQAKSDIEAKVDDIRRRLSLIQKSLGNGL